MGPNQTEKFYKAMETLNKMNIFLKISLTYLNFRVSQELQKLVRKDTFKTI